MNLQKLNPWNWFKHEQAANETKNRVSTNRHAVPPAANSLPDLWQWHRDVDRMFNDAGFGFPSLARQLPVANNLWNSMLNDSFMQSFNADVNVASDDRQYTITLEAPGLEKNDISIDLNDRVLVIKGNKQQEQEDKDKHYYRIERHYGTFERMLSIPDDADIDNIHANMDKGLLRISIPRNETAQPNVKRIDISNA